MFSFELNNANFNWVVLKSFFRILFNTLIMKNIAIFASGNGTNAEQIMEYFKDNRCIRIAYLFSNNRDAFVLKRAEKFNVPTQVFTRNEFYNLNGIVPFLLEKNIHFIVLAGFLWLVPKALIKAYHNKIVNIHPALLPAYGGKGMYGHHVHQSVIANNEKESGITIHYVNEQYDSGDIIFQARCPVVENDTSDTLAKRIHELEHKHFPQIIESVVTNI